MKKCRHSNGHVYQNNGNINEDIYEDVAVKGVTSTNKKATEKK